MKSGAKVAFSVGDTEGNDRPGSIRFCRCGIHKLFTIQDVVGLVRDYKVKPLGNLGLANSLPGAGRERGGRKKIMVNRLRTAPPEI